MNLLHSSGDSCATNDFAVQQRRLLRSDLNALHRNLQFGTGTYSIDASNSIIRSLTLRIFAYITGAVGILAIADFFILPG